MRPETEGELAEMLRAANAPLRVRGGGTRLSAPTADIILDVSRLRGITLYEPGALTLVARAGTPLEEIEETVAAQGQRLAFEPPDWRGMLRTGGASTIGGVVAANASGPRRVQAGAARDALMGVRFVDGTGMVVKNGGRVMKNVTGYDLVKLMAGSWGTLGVLTEVSLKVLPRPEATATLTVAAEDAKAAVRLMSQALTSPFDVSGAAWIPGTGAVIRIEGFPASVTYRAQRLNVLLSESSDVAVENDREASATIWQAVRDGGTLRGGAGDVWRLSVRPSEAPGIVSRVPGDVMLDWGGGLVWALVPEGTDLRAVLGEFAGHATLVRAGGTQGHMPRFPPEPPEIAALTAALRARFDPKGILNRGIMDGRGRPEGAMQ